MEKKGFIMAMILVAAWGMYGRSQTRRHPAPCQPAPKSVMVHPSSPGLSLFQVQEGICGALLQAGIFQMQEIKKYDDGKKTGFLRGKRKGSSARRI